MTTELVEGCKSFCHKIAIRISFLSAVSRSLSFTIFFSFFFLFVSFLHCSMWLFFFLLPLYSFLPLLNTVKDKVETSYIQQHWRNKGKEGKKRSHIEEYRKKQRGRKEKNRKSLLDLNDYLYSSHCKLTELIIHKKKPVNLSCIELSLLAISLGNSSPSNKYCQFLLHGSKLAVVKSLSFLCFWSREWFLWLQVRKNLLFSFVLLSFDLWIKVNLVSSIKLTCHSLTYVIGYQYSNTLFAYLLKQTLKGQSTAQN